jgi:hypothetical protein
VICSLGLSATSQQYFSLRTNQPPATSRNQPAVLFSQNKPAPAISHQPTEQARVRPWKTLKPASLPSERASSTRHERGAGRTRVPCVRSDSVRVTRAWIVSTIPLSAPALYVRRSIWRVAAHGGAGAACMPS